MKKKINIRLTVILLIVIGIASLGVSAWASTIRNEFITTSVRICYVCPRIMDEMLENDPNAFQIGTSVCMTFDPERSEYELFHEFMRTVPVWQCDDCTNYMWLRALNLNRERMMSY